MAGLNGFLNGGRLRMDGGRIVVVGGVIGQPVGHLPDDFQAFINMGGWDMRKHVMEKET
jgi:hypothetical protein